jgi:hypothetical protein
MTVRGSCLCDAVAWEADAPLELMHHCHCGRCRKAHGAAYATAAMCDVGGFGFLRGRDRIARYASSAELQRAFCDRCGSVVPNDRQPWNGNVFLMMGSLDDAFAERPGFHIFTASKAPWLDIRDDLPAFDAYPPGIDADVQPDLPPRTPASGASRGSCLCGGVTFVVTGEPLWSVHCHCTRCRKARGAAFASNLVTRADGVRLLAGKDLVASWKVPDARWFTTIFCRRCGAKAPRFDHERDLAIVPMGALDDDPGVRPQAHIFVGSKAPWDVITDDLPQHAAAAAGQSRSEQLSK